MTPRQSCDFLVRVLLKHKFKMTSDCKSLRCMIHGNLRFPISPASRGRSLNAINERVKSFLIFLLKKRQIFKLIQNSKIDLVGTLLKTRFSAIFRCFCQSRNSVICSPVATLIFYVDHISTVFQYKSVHSLYFKQFNIFLFTLILLK